jgi:hypothetical protein
MDPFAVRVEGAITQEGFRESEPVVVMVPPSRPAPAETEVTEPPVPETHSKPLRQAELAARY